MTDTPTTEVAHHLTLWQRVAEAVDDDELFEIVTALDLPEDPPVRAILRALDDNIDATRLALAHAGANAATGSPWHRSQFEDEARRLMTYIDKLRVARERILGAAPAFAFTIHVVLKKGVVDNPQDGADWIGYLLNEDENADVAGWSFVNIDGHYALPRPVLDNYQADGRP